MRRTLLWKEMRELAPVLALLLALELLLGLGFLHAPMRRMPGELFAGIALFAAAVVGTALFANEKRPGTLSFLFALPIARSRILTAKLGAGLVTLALVAGGGLLTNFVAIRMGWLVEAETLRRAGPWWLALGMAALLAGLLAARVALSWPEPLTPLLVGMAGGTAVAWGLGWIAGGVALAATFLWLWKGFAALEDRAPRWDGGAGTRRKSGLPWSPLTEVEWRQKRGMLAVLAALPLLSLAARWWLGSPSFGFACAGLAGTAAGVSLFTARERDAARFFLHHLPVRRELLVARRAAGGVVFGTLYALECLLAEAVPRIVNPSPGWLAGAFLALYLLPFLIGAALSPWLRSTVLSAVFTAVSAVVVLIALSEQSWISPFPWATLAVLAVLAAVAGWSNLYSRAFEPLPGKELRVALILFAIWAALAGIAS